MTAGEKSFPGATEGFRGCEEAVDGALLSFRGSLGIVFLALSVLGLAVAACGLTAGVEVLRGATADGRRVDAWVDAGELLSLFFDGSLGGMMRVDAEVKEGALVHDVSKPRT